MLVTINDYKTDKILTGPFVTDDRLPIYGDPIRFEINGIKHEGYVREVEHIYGETISSMIHTAIIYVNVTNVDDVIVAPNVRVIHGDDRKYDSISPERIEELNKMVDNIVEEDEFEADVRELDNNC